MLNQTGITKTTGMTGKNILVAPELAFSVSIKLANTSVEADPKGKKIVLAGTPLTGDIENRDTAFQVATSTEATCILLHDVDVTAGNANAQAVVFGFIDLGKIDPSVVSKITTAKEALSKKLTFIK